ncbi:MAG TPA: hypothetical protein VKA89_01785 [Solirubrobacterales bacterium]|nr:hypothetical protein [Solirubrobacterales bacterium]
MSSQAPEISRRFRAERNEGLHRVLRGLPTDFVVALIEGLEQADVITPGRLFAGDSGGCAVGVTLRVVEPDFRGSGALKRWRRKKSIQALYRGVAKSIPHLHALEHVFDRSVDLCSGENPALPKHEVAKAVALWVAAEARAELLLRELKADWLDAIEPAAITAPAPARPVVAPVPAFA